MTINGQTGDSSLGFFFKEVQSVCAFFHLIKKDLKCHINTVQMMLVMAPQSSPNSGTARLAAATANREVGKRTELV